MPTETLNIDLIRLDELVEIRPSLQDTKRRIEGGEQPILALTPAHISGNLEVEWDRPRFVKPDADPKRLERYAVHEGDLLLTLRLPVRAAIVGTLPKGVKEPVIAVGAVAIVGNEQSLACADPLLDSEYLAWCLGRPELFRELERETSGSALQLLSIAALKAIEIPVPSPAVQRRIATALAAQRRLESVLHRYVEASRRRTDALIANLLPSMTHCRTSRTTS